MGLFSGIADMFFGNDDYRNPADAGMEYLNQVPGVGKEYFNPFIDRGKRSGDILEGRYDAMANNPTDYLDQIMSKYRPSSGYDFKQKQMQRAAGNTAAAGGFRGTEADQQNSAQMIQDLLGSDMQQYLGNVLGIEGAGLQGHQGFQGQGYDAANKLASFLGTNLSNQSGLAFQGQAQNNKNEADTMAMFASLLGDVAGGGMSGKNMFGGAGKMSTNNMGASTANNFGGTSFRSPLTQGRSSPSGNFGSLWAGRG